MPWSEVIDLTMRPRTALWHSMGVCCRCGDDLDSNSTWYCTKHLRKFKRSRKKVTSKYVKAGLCPDCSGKEPSAPGRKIGLNCLARMKERRERLRAERMEKGLCITCGKEPAVRMVRGIKCRQKQLEYVKNRRNRDAKKISSAVHT